MSSFTRREFIASAASAVTLLAFDRAGVSASASPGAAYTPVTPVRLADTRLGFGTAPAGRVGSGGSVRVQVVGRSEVAVPANAVAVAVMVVAVDPSAGGYLTVWPSGTARPTASNVNFVAGVNRANTATVGIGVDGAISVYAHAAADVVVDLVGYYAPVAGPVAAGRVALAAPTRAYDSRISGGKVAARGVRRVSLAGFIPSGATAAVVNLTVTDPAGGFFSVLPALPSGPPSTSTVNTVAGETIAASTITPVDAALNVWVYSQRGGHVIVDVYGYITGPSAAPSTTGLFVPLPAPHRMLDTRTANNPLGATLRTWPGWTVETAVAGRGGVPTSGAAGIVGNVTFVDPHADGYLVTHPAGTSRPGTSAVNSRRGSNAANHLMCGVSTRGLAVWSHPGGHVIVDVAGYITGAAQQVAQITPAAQYAPAPVWPLTLTIPRTGQTFQVGGSTAASVIDAGRPGWFTGTGYPGGRGEMLIFGHRTTHGGPFRYLNLMRAGDRFTLSGDRRVAVYEVFDPRAGDGFGGFEVMSEAAAETFIAGAAARPVGVALIACTLPDGTPTSTAYRIVVRARLVEYRNT